MPQLVHEASITHFVDATDSGMQKIRPFPGEHAPLLSAKTFVVHLSGQNIVSSE